VTRFSFRFRPDDPVDKLLSDARLDERIRLFEKFCYSSIINQTNKKFYWILIIDPLLSQKYVDQLNQLINKHKNSLQYATKGPREIWLHTWDWNESTGIKLGKLDWILSYFPDSEVKTTKYMITTRLDDDDCLVNNFIDLVNKQLNKKPYVKGFRYISFSVGYQHYVKQQSLRFHKLPMIALGLTLITELNKYPMCVYLGCHTHILGYLKDPSKHAQMLALYQRNKDYSKNPAIIRKQFQERITVIRIGSAVWIRNVHDFNLQKNIGRNIKGKQDINKNKTILKDKFNVTM
jgi:hypothetical protein